MPAIFIMNIYCENGYVDMASIRGAGYPFTFVVGGRGTGKTYGALKDVVTSGVRFIFMRRTQTQLDIVAKEEFSPFKPLVEDGILPDIEHRKLSKYHTGFYSGGELIGYGMALRSMSNVRGFDASDVQVIIYDEFIPERHEPRMRGEGDALLNAYETINRNRELKGKPPVQLLCLANSNDIANPVFMALDLVTPAQKLHESRHKYSILPKRRVLLVDLKQSLISAQKAGTALYSLTGGTDFAKMALENDFSYNDISAQKSRPLAEYNPVVFVGELAVYTHKTNGGYYVTQHKKGAAPRFGSGAVDLARFQRAFAWLWFIYLQNGIEFEEYYLEALFTQYFKG